MVGEGLSEGDQDAVCARGDAEHLKRGGTGEVQALEAEPLFAFLSPVTRAADSAHIDASIGTDDGAVDAGHEALGEAEDRALENAVHAFDENALESAVGNVAVDHLAFVGAVVDRGGLAGGVADFVLGKPDDGRGFGEVGGAFKVYASVAVERAFDHGDDGAAGEPVALVVGDVEEAERAGADAIGGAQTLGHELVFAGFVVNFNDSSTIWVLGPGAATAGINGGGEGGVEVAVTVDEAERELVEVGGDAPAVGEGEVFVGDAVFVVVNELGELLLLKDVDIAVDDADAEGFGETRSEAGDGGLGVRAGAVADDVDPADGVPGADDEAAIGEEGEAADTGLEARDVEGGQVVAGVNVGERLTVAGSEPLTGEEDALLAGGGDADFAARGAQILSRDDFEIVHAGAFPFEAQGGVDFVFKVFDLEGVFPGVEFDDGGFGRGTVEAVVVNDDGVADREAAAVIAAEAKLVFAGGGGDDEASEDAEEVVGEASKVGVGEIEVRDNAADIGGLAADESWDAGHRGSDIVEAHGDTGFTRSGLFLDGPWGGRVHGRVAYGCAVRDGDGVGAVAKADSIASGCEPAADGARGDKGAGEVEFELGSGGQTFDAERAGHAGAGGPRFGGFGDGDDAPGGESDLVF